MTSPGPRPPANAAPPTAPKPNGPDLRRVARQTTALTDFPAARHPLDQLHAALALTTTPLTSSTPSTPLAPT